MGCWLSKTKADRASGRERDSREAPDKSRAWIAAGPVEVAGDEAGRGIGVALVRICDGEDAVSVAGPDEHVVAYLLDAGAHLPDPPLQGVEKDPVGCLLARAEGDQRAVWAPGLEQLGAGVVASGDALFSAAVDPDHPQLVRLPGDLRPVEDVLSVGADLRRAKAIVAAARRADDGFLVRPEVAGLDRASAVKLKIGIGDGKRPGKAPHDRARWAVGLFVGGGGRTGHEQGGDGEKGWSRPRSRHATPRGPRRE